MKIVKIKKGFVRTEKGEWINLNEINFFGIRLQNCDESEHKDKWTVYAYVKDNGAFIIACPFDYSEQAQEALDKGFEMIDNMRIK